VMEILFSGCKITEVANKSKSSTSTDSTATFWMALGWQPLPKQYSNTATQQTQQQNIQQQPYLYRLHCDVGNGIGVAAAAEVVGVFLCGLVEIACESGVK
jgi:hypothetical protein